MSCVQSAFQKKIYLGILSFTHNFRYLEDQTDGVLTPLSCCLLGFFVLLKSRVSV